MGSPTDVMDGSDRRRGEPALHLVFEQRHRNQGWSGDGGRFGEGIAVLIGDLAFVYADVLMSSARPAARGVFDELRLEVNLGQYLDMVATARREADAERARRICCYKSGRYTIERPLHLGAALAGRLDELAGPLSSFGGPLGTAFQLRDDLLGVFGQSARTPENRWARTYERANPVSSTPTPPAGRVGRQPACWPTGSVTPT